MGSNQGLRNLGDLTYEPSLIWTGRGSDGFGNNVKIKETASSHCDGHRGGFDFHVMDK